MLVARFDDGEEISIDELMETRSQLVYAKIELVEEGDHLCLADDYDPLCNHHVVIVDDEED